MTVDLPVLQQDINAIYSAELLTLQQKPPKEASKVSGDQKQEDYYKNFRTNVSNLHLVLGSEHEHTQSRVH